MKKTAWLVVFAMLFSILFANMPIGVGATGLDDGLVMHYDFEDEIVASVIKSANNSGYDAKADGVTVENGVAIFSGDVSAIILPENYATELTGSYSVSMWVNMDESVANSYAQYRFFDFGGGAYECQFLRYVPATGHLSFMDRSVANNVAHFAIDTMTDIKNGWTHLALVYDFAGGTRATATLYLNGKKLADSSKYENKLTNSIYDLAGSSSQNGFIGRTQWNDNTNPDFKGKMDEVRIYNRAVTADEISQLFETQSNNFPKVTVKFVDRNGEKLKDDVVFFSEKGAEYIAPDSLKGSFISSGYKYEYNPYRSTDSVVISDTNNVYAHLFLTSLSLAKVMEKTL